MGISTNFAAAVDIGYGGLKIVGGPAGSASTQEFVLPSGAAPLSSLPRRSDNTADLKGGELVLLDGQEWAGGVDQLHIQNRARMTHDDYPRTPEYEALYLTSLARLGERRIESLVTGLPVSQFYAPSGAQLIQFMRQKMLGRKLINADTVVDVASVMVVAQPLGTFFGLASEPEYASLATEDNLRTLVVDPGFFSVDWVVMAGKSVLHQHSGTSKKATSMILERAAEELTEELGREVTRDQLDAAMRRGQTHISTGFEQSTDFSGALNRAAAEVADSMVGELKTSLRTAGPIDLLVLTGGGSHLYAKGVKQAYAKVPVAQPSDVVLGNARGYAAIAKMQAKRLARSGVAQPA